MIVGYTGNNYPEKRNIIGRVEQNRYVNLSSKNYFAYINRINFWWKNFFGRSLMASDYYQFRSIAPLGVEGIHFFNSVCYSNTPWITTFETLLPYFDRVKRDFKRNPKWEQWAQDPHIVRAMQALSSDSCKKILALSQHTKKIQEEVLCHFPEFEKSILQKLDVLHPPQSAVEYQPRTFNGAFQLVFVGRAFYRKGGQELVHALDRLQKEIPLHLTIVSSLDAENGWPGINPKQIEEDKAWLKSQHWITYHEKLDNDEVLRLFEKSHLGFLPTWQDTYGYSVLEMQSRGCPVVTTAVRSLPEINPNTVGWTLMHDTNLWGEWKEIPTSRASSISDQLASDIYQVTSAILQTPQAMEAKGRAAVERVRQEHNPVTHAQTLSDYYQHLFKKK
ncbi:MAG: glycosyltransferase family 4 protein [Bacteroidetes bacterium]|nr:glycosyltransferase family 4 protein [Bacteroidota bacterium]